MNNYLPETAAPRLTIRKKNPSDYVVALAGNPNVGKSTIFNALTGMHQHTGNWPGKTVSNAQGYFTYNDHGYVLVDLPGCYSLMAHSPEEEAARDFLCFEDPDAVIVVCDATCLEHNLNLVLQIQELIPNVLVCINLMDEARKKGISVDLEQLSLRLNLPVIGTSARNRQGLPLLQEQLHSLLHTPLKSAPIISYPKPVKDAVRQLHADLTPWFHTEAKQLWMAHRLLEQNTSILHSFQALYNTTLKEQEPLKTHLSHIQDELYLKGYPADCIQDISISTLVLTAENYCQSVITYSNSDYRQKDRSYDKWFTSKWTGFPIMFLGLLFILWLTITGANYPSQLLNTLFLKLEDILLNLLILINTPPIIQSILIDGIYRVVSWIIAVMFPPMAIFFPLFTLLEDSGYLPRVAFNLDRIYQKCCACGKQALTMCMGFGCNAVGVTGCRIIDSPRERLLGILTNSFVPCNGRFPTLIALCSMFFLSSSSENSFLSALLLSILILLAVFMTFLVSKLLSLTILKGLPSSFILELPPYRRPQIGKVIVRSIFDRTLFVLGRAISVAAPAGLLLWLMTNCHIAQTSLLTYCCRFLDPFAKLLGMDGVILFSFLLGMPANEIVLPIIVMIYSQGSTLQQLGDIDSLRTILMANGWTWATAASTTIFTLMHWPCATTLLTIKKETQSLKWTLVSFLLPTLSGMILCMLLTAFARLL